jgi:hypothetical protein
MKDVVTVPHLVEKLWIWFPQIDPPLFTDYWFYVYFDDMKGKFSYFFSIYKLEPAVMAPLEALFGKWSGQHIYQVFSRFWIKDSLSLR